jgi:hypothetical protein
MVWPTSPGAMACSRRVLWFLGAPAGLEASSIRAARQSDRDDCRANERRTHSSARRREGHVASRSRRAAILLYEATRTTTHQPSYSGATACYEGLVVGAVVGIPRWHAGGQKMEAEVS